MIRPRLAGGVILGIAIGMAVGVGAYTFVYALEGMRVLKASQGIQNYDVNKQATRQEMRAYVCGQCHDEYHFSGPEKRLVYPWSKGLKSGEHSRFL
jgi:formate-dependent nitrite reductase cytochrome c552 subunit